MCTLIDWIEQQMRDDDDDREKQSDKLRAMYEDATKLERRAIDEAFVCLCGCSLETAVKATSA